MLKCDCFCHSCKAELEVGTPDTKTAPSLVPIRIHASIDQSPTVWLDHKAVGDLIRQLKEAQTEIRE